MQKIPQLIVNEMKQLVGALLIVMAAFVLTPAQSTNIEFPTPVIAGEISGEIVARDIGDPRLTRHYYILTGTPGDLVLTVESHNLNGDVDLFTAGTLRPLLKLSIYAGLSQSSTSKSVFMRRREPLILRVEARSANDERGSYRIRFSGGFEPLAETTDAPENQEPTVSTSPSRDKNARRVNSAGARLNEEPPAVAATEPAQPPPAITIEEEKPEPETTAPANPAPARTNRGTRTGRTRTPRPARRKTATTAQKRPEPAPAPAPAPAEPLTGARLIIETTDGMRVERYMSEVRRMTVEKGQLIVVTNDGKIERRLMTTVLRVTIEP